MATRSPEEQRLLEDNDRLNKELDCARRQTESMRQELQSFIYAAGHDLKQALRTIGSYSQLLARGGALDPQSVEYTHFILDGVRSATSLVEQLVILSKAGTSPNRASVNLAACVHTALYKLQGLVSQSNAKVTCADLPEVFVNQADFDQVFECLIENAIRYAGPVTPEIHISAEEGDDGHLISVRDNGLGVEAAYHQEIFRPFRRLHGREIPGAGVGLSLCKKIIEAHDGQLWVESEGHGGSVFKFSLPY